MSVLVGVDEVGRGPLAGPVVTCAVLWPDDHGIAELDDSKKLSAAKRESLIPLILDKALQISFGRAEVEEIDTLNILHATMLAMERAVEGLGEFDAPIRIDGNRVPDGLKQRARAVVGGDGLVAAIPRLQFLLKWHAMTRWLHWLKSILGMAWKGMQVTQPRRISKRWNCLVYRQSIDARLVR